jgi:F-type H+-transporting ATPase subunit b
MSDVLTTLGIDGYAFLWHTLNFIVLIGLLYKFLYTPVVGLLDERTKRIEESLAAAERAQAEVAQADREREELLASTRRDIQEMMTTAQQVAERIQTEARTTAQQEAQRIIETARQEAEAERAQAMAELRREVASLAVQAAERIISRNLDDQAQRQLVDEFLDERPASTQAGRA